MAVEHLSKKFPGIYEKRSTTPTLFQLRLLYPEVERRSPGWHGPRSPRRAPTGPGPGAATPAGLPQGRPAHSGTLGGAAWTSRPTSLRAPSSSEPPRPSVGTHNTWAAWPTGFIGWKLAQLPALVCQPCLHPFPALAIMKSFSCSEVPCSLDRKSTRLNSSHRHTSRMPSH